MIIRTLSAVAIGAVAFAVLAGQQSPPSKPAQTPPAKPPEVSPEDQQMMQDAMPGPIHEHMKKCVGEYTTKTKMSGAGAPPGDEEAGTAKISMSLDGRFLVVEQNGMMMGMPIKTMKIHGYNNAAKQYEAVWMYTMSTGMLAMTGESKDNGKTIEWKGTYKEGDGDHTLLVTTTHVDENAFIEKIHHADGAEDGPVMETTFTRKK